ncbi:unnamed protein product [Darwinula stevensoni]|uniref:START domain-containing protein n=1 Tax=Darwinula stevensoni TaxID=69355 RepID=A0A7R9ACZ0_9CRUS|nr:unnamed protein product [Darwinula stevensoni]CAG0900496.1 unnamed protein product [Darwinula stevensoni]
MQTAAVRSGALGGNFALATIVFLQDLIFMESVCRDEEKGEWEFCPLDDTLKSQVSPSPITPFPPTQSRNQISRTISFEADPRSQLRDYSDDGEAAVEKLVNNIHRDDWIQFEDYDGIAVHSRYDSESKREIYKLQTVLDFDLEWAFRQTWHTVNDSPKWDSDVLSSNILLDVSEMKCRVFHAVTRPRAFGVVSSRDFVSLEYVKRVGETYYWSVSSTTWPDLPPGRDVVRAHLNPGGGVVFSRHEEDEGKTLYRLIPMMEFNVPFLPRGIMDRLLLARQRDFIVRLRDRLSFLHSLS